MYILPAQALSKSNLFHSFVTEKITLIQSLWKLFGIVYYSCTTTFSVISNSTPRKKPPSNVFIFPKMTHKAHEFVI